MRRRFPRQIDNFRRLVASLHDYDQFGQSGAARSARKVVGEIIDDPLLVEMLLCPILFYGGSREHDIDFDQFSIMFRAIFLEGLARPHGRHSVDPEDAGPAVQGAWAASFACGRPWRRSSSRTTPSKRWCWRTARRSRPATCSRRPVGPRRCGCATTAGAGEEPPPGRLSFVESISILDSQPRSLGCDKTIVFYNDSETVPLRKARRSGRSAQRHDLLAEQFLLRRAAAAKA